MSDLVVASGVRRSSKACPPSPGSDNAESCFGLGPQTKAGRLGGSSGEKRPADRVAKLSQALPVEPPRETVLHHYGRIRAELDATGTPIGGMDLLLAAHALALEACVVTANTREFARIDGLAVENWRGVCPQERLAKLVGGVALVRCQAALEGLKGASDEENIGIRILCRSIEEPTRWIARNAGAEPSIVIDRIRAGKGSYGYNAASGQYEDLIKAGIVDPTKVVRTALQNASSVAGLMLTTEAAIAEKPKEDKGGGMPGGHDGGMGGMGGMM